MRMPRKARAAMNRAGMQDPEELKRRRKRFREMARAYKAEETLKNVKRTAKDVGKEVLTELVAPAVVGGAAGMALKGGVKAYRALKGAKKVSKGTEKMLKAGPGRRLPTSPRAKAAEKIQRSGPPKFKKKIKRSGPPEFERTRKKVYQDELSEPRPMSKRPAKASKTYKLNKSGEPPAPKPKAKRKKPAKRKAGAPVKQTPSKPVKFDKKRGSRSEIRKNRAVQNNPRRIVRKLESRLKTRKQIRRGYQQDYNEMQRKGTTEFMRRHPDFVKGMSKDFYRPDKFLARKKRGMETYKRKIYETQMDLEKARRRAKRSQIKPRRRN